MPNQQQAISARRMAARLAPRTANDARANTGYGMPYLVPAWLLSSIEIRTTTLATVIVISACTQFILLAAALRAHLVTYRVVPVSVAVNL